MTHSPVDTLTQRPDRLERQLWWWRYGTVTSLTALSLLLLLGAVQTPREIQARRFTLIGVDGKPTAWLGLNDSSRPVLSLWDGPSFAALEVDSRTASLTLRGSVTARGVETGTTILSSHGLMAQRASDPATISLVTNSGEAKTPILAITGTDGSTVWKAP